MIRSFAKSIENRKILAERIAAITKMDMNYTRAPRFAYEIGAFTVEKDGTLIVGEGAADGVVAVLKSEGLIGEELTPPASEQEQIEQTEEQAQVEQIERADQAETAIAAENSLLGQEDWGEEPEPEPEEPEQEPESEAKSESTASEPADPAEATETAEPAGTLTETLNVSEPLNEPTETAPESAGIESSLEMDEIDEATKAEETEPTETAEAEPTETVETAELAEGENPAETENVETLPETQGVEAESEAEAETEIEPQEAEAESETENRIDGNCLLGTEDWGDESIEQAAIDETAESAEVAATMPETAELSQEEQLIEAEQAYEDPLEISELSNRPSMGASEANAEQPQGAGWDTSESSDGRDYDSRIPTGLSMADMTDMTGFTFPLADHTIGSILNIISMIYTRGPLLSKATGGNFGVDKDLITILADDDEYESKEFLVDFIREHVEEGARLDGISFTDTHVIFTGFPQAITDNATTDKAVTDRGMTAERGERDESLEKLEVFKRLAARMNKMAKEQKRIVPKEITEPNEKYALRIWLIRLGMNGADCKADRKILLQNLSGHTAFRTEADKEKWIARQNAKKRKTHVAYEGPTGTTATEPMATNAPNTLTSTETATALMATESTITAKEAL